MKFDKEYHKRYYWKHRQRKLETAKAYRIRNHARLLARRKELYYKNRELHLLRYTKYYYGNLKKCREKSRKWRITNLERVKNNEKEYRRTHKRQILFKNLQRWNKLRGAVGEHCLEEWISLKKRFNFTCPACGLIEPKVKLTEDHIVPISKGGNNFIDNIQPLCRSCNSKKYTKILTYA